MSANLPQLTNVGAGTLTSGTSTNATVTINLGFSPGELLALVCYMEGDATAVIDAGDGWTIMDSGYNPANAFGIFLAVMVPRRVTGGLGAGFTLPASVAWTCQHYVLRIALPQVYRFAPEFGSRSNGWFNNPASGTAQDAPAISPSHSSGIYLIGRGNNNGGTLRTMASIGSHTELFDTGQTSPAHGICLNRMTETQRTAVAQGVVTSAASAAVTKRAGVRCFVPIIQNNTLMGGRYFNNRRIG